ncbi:hypothetical protein [Fortiea contorta]|uniref:hypothetical protein n=1 Tax=Fortiea contorta TaxID=1892405 RepID=UPI0003498604|nr:hypothetical protein [Fortiea contorta]
MKVSEDFRVLCSNSNTKLQISKYRDREHYEKLAREQGISDEILATNCHSQQ